MTLYGSKSKELLRSVALKTLNDDQRKVAKGFFFKIRSLPARIFGLSSALEDQSQQINRLKARLALFDGKLNVALYGMPKVEPLRAAPLSHPLLDRILLDPETAALIRSLEHTPFPQSALNSLGDFKPKSTLEVGRNTGVTSVTVPAIFPSSHPIDQLLAMTDFEEQDLVLCHAFLSELTPREQIYFLAILKKRMARNSRFILTLPDFSNADKYWANPHHLRPYSTSLIERVLAPEMTQVVHSHAENCEFWIFKK